VFYIGGSDTLPPPLNAEEELAAITGFMNGSKKDRDLLIEHNLRLVVYIAKKFESAGVNVEDLISIGTIGLIKAVNTFKIEKNIKLATYASRCIENEILMHFRNGKKSAQDMSLSDSIDTDKDGNPLMLMDVLAVDDDFTEDLEEQVNLSKLKSYINEVLNEREKKIIVLRYGLNGNKPLTQREVADMLNISRSYISRIEKRALYLLRKRYDKTD